MRAFLLLAAVLVAARPDPVAVATVMPVPPVKTIALSFDDAPRGPGAFLSVDRRNTKLIAALRDAGVEQAAFFLNPGRITPGDGDEQRIGRYVAAGHVIANHTFLHAHLSAISAAAFVDQIDKADDWLKGRPGFRPWFRFPALDEGGPNKAKRDAVRAGLKARGLRNGYASVDGSDWFMEGQTIAAKKAGKPIDMAALRDLYVETMVQSANFSDDLMRRTLGRAVPQMLLLHETDIAALFVADLVAALRRDGWTIVTADRAFADPAYRVQPDIPWANGTLAEQLAWAHKLPGQRWFDRNDRKVATALFTDRVLHGAGTEALPDGAALAKAAALPHIPVPLRGCWQSPDARARLTLGYATIEIAGSPKRYAMAASVSRVAPRRIDGDFLLPTPTGRRTLARTLSLGPDALGTLPGQLRMTGGGAGDRAFIRCS
ncbi:polysaccharide deacetylase family protein [Sphingomonas sp. Leaf357]|uniref:polysaccharide deacetylase family protein n=1 Tax=Sphingomonas sp. Leaf357 TaxID=1736350 RepID=UPI0009EBAE8D|nr:polysaccharide deacetylase family protein [Sphingomonas sp. Leaf357]